MDDTYDAIICGTGLIECVISGLLSTNGYKVLHIDRNDYYGGECASLNLKQLFEKFNRPLPTGEALTALGQSHLYNVDLIPKVLMCAGELVKILKATVVDRYGMEFMLIENSFVYKSSKIHKVPVTESEALSSGLMGFFEKRHAASFFAYLSNYDPEDPKTHKGYDLSKMTMVELYKKFKLGNDTIEFVGHAVALHTDDSYLNEPALPTVMKCKLYEDSLDMYGSSPYVYPLYGSGELPQVYSRLSAVYGGTYMLNTPVDSINFDEKGVFDSITSEGKTCKAKFIVGDPSYFKDRVKRIGKVVRGIFIMNHPIPNTHDSKSCQIIIPQKELAKCKASAGGNSEASCHDMYILQLSSVNNVCPEGKYIVIIGIAVDINSKNPEVELEPGIKLLGPYLHKFVTVSDQFVPLDNGTKSKCFISNSYDSATHFETAADNILSLFHLIHGKPYKFDTAAGNDPDRPVVDVEVSK